MELEEKDEEILETLWIRNEEHSEPSLSLDYLQTTEKEVQPLLAAGYVDLTGDRVSLTAEGKSRARSVVRRHRLAERLLADVLGSRDTIIHDKACRFEHIIDQGLDESICILLGHPKICPHGTPIPPGPCCEQQQRQVSRLVLPLSQVAEGQKGKVAYIYAQASEELKKLMAMGVLPGAPITLLQRFPSYVFQLHQAQFAVDREIAGSIYVRLVPGEPSPATPDRHGIGRHWHGFTGWRRRGGKEDHKQ